MLPTPCLLDDLPIGASRFAGVPDLPHGFEWPTHDGVALTFLAQIRMADVAHLELEAFPRRGWLLFFLDTETANATFRGEVSDPPAIRVVYLFGAPSAAGAIADGADATDDDVHAASTLVRAAPRAGGPFASQLSPCSLEFVRGVDLPDPSDARILRLGIELSPDDRDVYADLAREVAAVMGDEPYHHLGGEPQFCGRDVRGDETPCESGESGEWDGGRRLLLQLDTDEDGPGWVWGGGRRLYFWIGDDDLCALRFERTLLKPRD